MRASPEKYTELKKDLLRVYPDLRKFFEVFEVKMGRKDFTYGDASDCLYKQLLKAKDAMHLIKQLNIGFICPDSEWRSKVC